MSDTAARRILVTGAAGFLGAAVAGHLAARDDVDLVVGVDVDGRRIPDENGVVGLHRDVRLGIGDLLEHHGIDAVVHHAFVIGQARDRRWAHEVNVDATERLAADANAAGTARVVYPSSTTIYGAWAGAGAHSEDEEPRPIPGFMYSEHKVVAERKLRAAASHPHPAVMILRGCIVLAPGAHNFITSSLALPVVPVVAGADPPMQLLHISDYVAAVDAALRAGASGTWNVAGRGTVTWRELVGLAGGRIVPVPGVMLRRLVDVSWRLRLQNRSDSTGLALSRYPWLASTEKIHRDLGWEPRYSSREAAEAWARG